MRKELDNLNAYNEREMWKIKRMRRRRKPKQVFVVKMMNLNQAFQAQVQEAKPEKNSKPRKAPLSISHGGPTKILRKTKEFVEKDKI